MLWENMEWKISNLKWKDRYQFGKKGFLGIWMGSCSKREKCENEQRKIFNLKNQI